MMLFNHEAIPSPIITHYMVSRWIGHRANHSSYDRYSASFAAFFDGPRETRRV